MRFSRVPVALASLLGLVIALCLPQQAGAAVAAGAAVQAGQASPASLVGPGGRASGSDSSCPAASPAAAGAANVSAPTGVRAIHGDGSATVVWCPPASGAGSVASYTVTSSGGQSVTAKVPDDWAIVDGLTDGTSYTFTVTANAASSSGPPSAATAPVTPARPAAPAGVLRGGQTIALSGSGGTLGFLAAANNSAESGTGTIYYTDGSTQTFTLNVGNFWYPSGQNGNPSNTQVAGVNYANYPTGSSGHEVYLFEQSVSLQSGKTVEAVTLPSLGDVAGYNAALHIFAIAVG
jgi:hypothetical protein